MNLTLNQQVTIGIRPEYIQWRDQPGDNTFLSTIDRVAEVVTTNNYYFHISTVGSSRR